MTPCTRSTHITHTQINNLYTQGFRVESTDKKSNKRSNTCAKFAPKTWHPISGWGLSKKNRWKESSPCNNSWMCCQLQPESITGGKVSQVPSPRFNWPSCGVFHKRQSFHLLLPCFYTANKHPFQCSSWLWGSLKFLSASTWREKYGWCDFFRRIMLQIQVSCNHKNIW